MSLRPHSSNLAPCTHGLDWVICPAAAALPTATVVLDVSGMKCGGCSAAVKRILNNQPGVVNAAVNLLTETAAITVTTSPVSPESLESPAAAAAAASASPPTQHALELASKAAEALSTKGFPSKLRASESSAVLSDEAETKRAAEARASLVNLVVAGSLVVLCCTHHVGHLLHALGYHQFAHGAFMQVSIGGSRSRREGKEGYQYE